MPAHSKIHIHARACNILYTVYVYDDILYVCDLGRDRFVRLYLYIIKIVFCFVLTWIPVIFGREDCNPYVMLGLNKGFKKKLKNMVLGSTFLSLTAWWQVSETIWLQNRSTGRNLGRLRYDALAPRSEVLRSFSSLYANSVLFVYARAGVLELNLLRYSWNDIRVPYEINTEGCQ